MRSEAHRLADIIEQDPTTTWGYREASHAAAAELRRLIAVEQELLSVLRNIGKYTGEGPFYTTPWQEIVADIGKEARAAVARSEE
jgi:hypothetical protein